MLLEDYHSRTFTHLLRKVQGMIFLSAALLESEFRDLNSRDRPGTTPLHWACHRGDSPAVELLLR